MLCSRASCLSRLAVPQHVRLFHSSPPAYKIVAGRYRATLDKSFPLTYEMAMKPEEIASKKSFNSFNTGQLEGTFGFKGPARDIGGPILSFKLLIEDMFIRKFLKGTWNKQFLSEIIIKRQHNTIRIAALLHKKIETRKIYFLIGYTEEILSLWLKCPVKLELQMINDPKEVIYKYI